MAIEEEPAQGVPEWVVTYGDMMSLLLTFFIMLVSLSEIKQDDGSVRAMMDAIRQAFGPTMGTSGVPGQSLQTTSSLSQRRSQGSRSEGGTKRDSRKSKGQAGAHRTVQRINHGTVVTLGGPTLFRRFDASLTEDLKQNLDILAKIIGPKQNRLVVKGHASPEPLPPEVQIEFDGFPVRDPFDLSFARARAVAGYLISQGIDGRRILVSAAGDTEPRTRTRQKDSQKFNRRVDVFLIDAYITHPPPEDSKIR